MHPTYVALNEVTLKTDAWLYGVHVTCAETAAVSRGIMVIHPHKTKCMVLTTKQRHQRRPLTLNLTLEKSPVQQVCEHRVLGVIIDEELKWQSHIDNICKHLSKNIFLLSQLRHYVDSDARKIFFQAHLLSHINYASTV